MDITFLVPGMPFSGTTLTEEKSLGGSETMGLLLAKELASRGHRIRMFTSLHVDPYILDGVYFQWMGESTQAHPYGDAFHSWAEHIPQDVLVIQRIPGAFGFKFAAKVNLWWTHDLALKRFLPQVMGQLWNVDRICAVSEWHKAQIAETYGVKEGSIGVLRNGVLPSRFGEPTPALAKMEGKKVLYSSRPERGLPLFLDVAEALPEMKFLVCGYDNTTPQMAAFYESCYARARSLPNVQVLGALGQGSLARVMKTAWLHLYPTAFEETSCITVMEEQAAGTPIVTRRVGALPETLEGGGVWWVEGETVQDYVKALLYLRDNPKRYEALYERALSVAKGMTISRTADDFEEIVRGVFKEGSRQPNRLAAHFLRTSDIVPLRMVLADGTDGIRTRISSEVEECYSFTKDEESVRAHYERYYEREKEIHPTAYKPENLDQSFRYIATVRLIEKLNLPPGARVLDYGCAHGHYTINLAKRFPDLLFTGIDFSSFNLEIASKWAVDDGVTERVSFVLGSKEQLANYPGAFDLVIAAEVVEHVLQPAELIDLLGATLKPSGHVIVTTPYGPWEAIGFQKEWPWRAHLWHFEAADLRWMLASHPDFEMDIVPAGKTESHEVVGSFICLFGKPSTPTKQPNRASKFEMQNPMETLSVCMIVRGDGDGLGKTLRSVAPIADEIILGVDGPGPAWEIAKKFRAQAFEAESPTKIGFAEARNRTISKASGDWILWIDDDEELLYPDQLSIFLRPNQWDSYAMHHIHVSAEPAGVLKTDFPTRLFRNRIGFKFHGVVHEHPEIGKMGGGAGRCFLLPAPQGAISHPGYVSEKTRRERFGRNLPLMIRDREENPQRQLGKFLWIRDLCHLNRFEAEQGQLQRERGAGRAAEAVRLWRELIQEGNAHLCIDSLQYLSEATALLTGGQGVLFEFSLGLGIMGVGDRVGEVAAPVVSARFPSVEDAQSLLAMVLRDKIGVVNSRYL